MEDFDNQLVRQKNKIIELIDDNKIQQAKAALAVVTEIWEANSYGYKVKELKDRIDLAGTRARRKKEMLEAFEATILPQIVNANNDHDIH